MRNFTPAPFWFVFVTLLRLGHFADEQFRLGFCFTLLTFADLESYRRWHALAHAFSPRGTFLLRCREAAMLALTGPLEKQDYQYAARRTAETLEGCHHG